MSPVQAKSRDGISANVGTTRITMFLLLEWEIIKAYNLKLWRPFGYYGRMKLTMWEAEQRDRKK